MEANTKNEGPGGLLDFGIQQKHLHRRSFLRLAGTAVAASAVLGVIGCRDGEDPLTPAVDFGSGDTAILNYAYALEQLEAAFYAQVIASPYAGITTEERTLLTDIRDHEAIHREFFKAALGGDAIQGLTPNFSAVNFSSRDSVLATAKTFEDLGVSAYNGAGRYLVSADFLTIAGQIVSVEARHAAWIRDMISNGTFADSTVVDNMGLDVVRKPREVIALAQPFVLERLNANSLPA